MCEVVAGGSVGGRVPGEQPVLDADARRISNVLEHREVVVCAVCGLGGERGLAEARGGGIDPVVEGLWGGKGSVGTGQGVRGEGDDNRTLLLKRLSMAAEDRVETEFTCQCSDSWALGAQSGIASA